LAATDNLLVWCLTQMIVYRVRLLLFLSAPEVRRYTSPGHRPGV